MNDDLRQLIAARAPAYIAERMESDKRQAAADAEQERWEREAHVRRAAAKQAVATIFDWLASPPGVELLQELRAAGLGRVPFGSGDTTLVVDDGDGCVRVRFYRFAKQWSQSRAFAAASEYEAFVASGATDTAITCFDEPARALADLIASGTVLVRITECLRTMHYSTAHCRWLTDAPP